MVEFINIDNLSVGVGDRLCGCVCVSVSRQAGRLRRYRGHLHPEDPCVICKTAGTPRKDQPPPPSTADLMFTSLLLT